MIIIPGRDGTEQYLKPPTSVPVSHCMSVAWEHYFKSPGHNTATTLLWRATVVHASSTLVAVPCEPYHARHGAKSHMQHLAAEIIPC